VAPERELTQAPGTLALATSSTDDGLSITTDKDDYAPGDTVWFTGAGWPANDVLDIVLEDEPATHPPHTWTIPVSEDGTFRDSTYVVDVDDIGVTFTLTATSRATGRSLSVTFTDAVVLDNVATFTPASPVIGGTFSVGLTATFTGLGGTWKGTEWWIDTGSKTCVNTTDFVIVQTPPSQAQGSVTLTGLTTPTPAGSHTLHVQLYSSDTCSPSSGPGSTKVGGEKEYEFEVIGASNQAPTADAGTYGDQYEGADITLDGSGSQDPDGDPITYAWSIVSFTNPDGGQCSFENNVNTGVAPTVVCDDDGALTVSLTVTDDKNLSSAAVQALITVKNVKPAIGTLTGPDPDNDPLPSSIIVGGTLTIKVPFTDPGSNDTHKAEIDCGSGSYGAENDVSSPSFETSCTFSTVGSKTVRVRVTDDDGGYDVKTHDVSVQYDFYGLFEPVNRPNTMNVSKAGQGIPLKWLLKDFFGNPITTLSAVTVKVTPQTCLLGSTADQVEEYATGSSGLQNFLDGNYQFNWATPKSYAKSCKTIGLDLGEGFVRTDLAWFSFKN
jgi:hypothetical protein